MDEDEKARRRRALLDSYYMDDADSDDNEGVDSAGGSSNAGPSGDARRTGAGASAAAPVVTRAQRSDMDSTHFEADLYLSSVLRESPLTSLISKRNEVVAEARTLDADMQMLVYENYEKFIAATDTIRDMKSNMEAMEAEVNTLRDAVEKVDAGSKKVEDGLAEGRGRIEHLSGIRRLLKKIEFLFQLPKRLKRSVELGAYAQAVRYYSISNRALRRYSDIASFKAIQEEADEIIGGLREKLTRDLRESSGSTIELADTVTLLLKLGEPAAELRADYIARGEARLRAALEAAKDDAAASENLGATDKSGDDGDVGSGDGDATGADAGAAESSAPFVHFLSHRFVVPFAEFAKSYRRLFLPPADSSDAAANPTAEERSAANHQLADCARGLFADYFALVEARVSCAGDTSDDVADVVTALEVTAGDAQVAHQFAPHADLLAAGTGLVDTLLRGKCDAVFARCARRTTAALAALDALTGSAAADAGGDAGDGDAPVGIGATCSRLAANTVVWATEALEALAPIARARGSGGAISARAEAIAPAVHRGAESLVSGALAALEALTHEAAGDATAARDGFTALRDGGSPFAFLAAPRLGDGAKGKDDGAEDTPAITPGPCFGAVAARLALHYEASAVRKLSSAVNDAFPTSDRGGASFDAAGAMGASRSAATRCLEVFVSAQGLRVGKMMRTSVENIDWLAVTKEPRDVRASSVMVAEDVAQVRLVVAQLFGDGQGDGGGGGGGDGRAIGRGSVSAPSGRGARTIESGIERLFAKKLQIFGTGPASFETASIMGGIVRVPLKTYIETVRCKTFSKFGLQKMQVDSHYLRVTLRESVDDVEVLDTLLDEVMTSCNDRCVDPQGLDQGIVEALVERRIEKSRK